jgi:hypothetical protein
VLEQLRWIVNGFEMTRATTGLRLVEIRLNREPMPPTGVSRLLEFVNPE